jgi:hypothetical protein
MDTKERSSEEQGEDSRRKCVWSPSGDGEGNEKEGREMRERMAREMRRREGK